MSTGERTMNKLDADVNGLYTMLPNGRRAEIVPLTFRRARIALVSEMHPLVYDDMW